LDKHTVSNFREMVRANRESPCREIKLHPNMNREDGFSLSRSWKPLTCALKEHKQALAKDMAHTFLHPSSIHGPSDDFLNTYP
jgi:hypothetical protein